METDSATLSDGICLCIFFRNIFYVYFKDGALVKLVNLRKYRKFEIR